MTKKLLGLVAAAVLSAGVSLSARNVESVSLDSATLKVAQELVVELKNQGISEQEIIAALQSDESLVAHDGFVTPFLNQVMSTGGSVCTTPVTVGMVATVVVALALVKYAGPALMEKVLRPAGAWFAALRGKCKRAPKKVD